MGGMRRLFGEPEREPALGAALRSLEQAAPEPDADMLRRKIAVAARPRLMALASHEPRWWELLSVWGRLAVPLGLAVAVVGVLLMPSSRELSVSTDSPDTGSDTTLLAALSSEAGGRVANLIAPASQDWLLEQAISR
jgi:hypothetical protein